MEQDIQRYPLGLQTFSELKRMGCVYIDKTPYIWRMTHSSAKYNFLSRPRRFGKSLLVSTLHSYFAGERELFCGTYIGGVEKEWTQYPVLHFDMSGGKHLKEDALERYLLYELECNESNFGIVSHATDTNVRFLNLIQAVYKQTGKQVVVLIDEYDAPLLDVVHKDDELEKLRYQMRNFYSPLKMCEPYLRFVFITGITKFSQLSIFSELNNLRNISMMPAFSAICGITEDEMLSQLQPGINNLAQVLGVSYDAAVEQLKLLYDGYHFTKSSPDIYNPYSLLFALDEGDLGYHWFDSGTSTFIIELFRKYGMRPEDFHQSCYSYEFDAPTMHLTNPTPLLYQAGYLTIKDYDRSEDAYTLDIPNKEVRIGLFRGLLPLYVQSPENANDTLRKMKRSISGGDIDGALRTLQTYLATVPYTRDASSEGHYQSVLFVIFTLLGFTADVEVHTPRGRVDLVVKTDKQLYLIEVKMDKTAAAAMEQINLKDYAARFALSGLPVVRVGVNFDSAKRNISDWVIESR